ncbi:MAG: 30S ribosomal protein S18 [Candidatus Kaiserbacteria bacterium]|nr:30S ribosomal protein S18 [Candidatus Kaiserbacteria bacterium]
MQTKRQPCYFTTHDIQHVDFRDVHLIQKFLDPHGRLLSRRRTGLSARYQRRVGQAVKRARYMALLPYIRR